VLHVRVITPPSTTDQVLDVADCCPAVVNVVTYMGAARRPAGAMRRSPPTSTERM